MGSLQNLMMMMGGVEEVRFEVPTLNYSSLLLLDEGKPRSLDALLGSCGLLAIEEVPGLGELRTRLLPLARTLALLSPGERASLLKEHGLGTDVPLKEPDRPVSSFAAQLDFAENSETGEERRPRNDLEELGFLFRCLGVLMTKVGLLVARLCDVALHPVVELEQSIMESRTAKARLIHYHSLQDQSILKGNPSNARKKSVEGDTESPRVGKPWQQWHFDYGLFTVLTAPMFFTSLNLLAHPCQPPYEHIGLKILNTSNNKIELVNVAENSLLIQVGEAAEILTGGKLQATAHCVCRPLDRPDVSRETYVVFLQPSWQKRLVSEDWTPLNTNLINQELKDIYNSIPPLASRWKQGCTFAEFSKQTTRQYYGAAGLQSKR